MTVQFSQAAYSLAENGGSLQITVTRSGDASGAATVDYATSDNSALQKSDFTIALGTVFFAAGDTTKTFTLLVNEDSYLEGTETLTLTLSNPTGARLGTQSTATVSLLDTTTDTSANSIDDTRKFVVQQYHDFLNREPDAGGLAYWTSQIAQCGADQTCVNRKRRDVSAAFFVEQEYQQTGYYVYRIFKASFGRQATYLEYTRGRNQVIGGSDLATGQALVAAQSVNPAYGTLDNASYVDQLYRNTGVTPDRAERDNLVAGLNNQSETRASVLQKVANNQTFASAEYNAAFVLAEYFGYLRRDPEAGGYQFWLDVLNNRVPNNYQSMVCAFITSKEYQDRFGALTTRNDSVCKQ